MAAALGTLVTGGTNRTAEDDLAISLVRSHVELEQTVVDEQRTAALTASIDALRVERPLGAVPTTELLLTGARRAPWVATSDELARARKQEQLDALTAVAKGGEDDPIGTPHDPERMPELDALPRGRSAHTRLVDSDLELRTLFSALTQGGTPIDRSSYPGVGFRRPDGVLVYLRERSTSGGATIDVVLANGATRKVHIR
jgi:hypothetical protein